MEAHRRWIFKKATETPDFYAKMINHLRNSFLLQHFRYTMPCRKITQRELIIKKTFNNWNFSWKLPIMSLCLIAFIITNSVTADGLFTKRQIIQKYMSMNTVFQGCYSNFLTEKWRHSKGIIILKVYVTRKFFFAVFNSSICIKHVFEIKTR